MSTNGSHCGIDLANETLLTLKEAPRVLPKLRGGKPIHIGTLYRWINQGRQGVRLESAKIGRTHVTSLEALQRFVDRTNGSAPSSRVQRPRGHDEATDKELDRHGL